MWDLSCRFTPQLQSSVSYDHASIRFYFDIKKNPTLISMPSFILTPATLLKVSDEEERQRDIEAWGGGLLTAPHCSRPCHCFSHNSRSLRWQSFLPVVVLPLHLPWGRLRYNSCRDHKCMFLSWCNLEGKKNLLCSAAEGLVVQWGCILAWASLGFGL